MKQPYVIQAEVQPKDIQVRANSISNFFKDKDKNKNKK